MPTEWEQDVAEIYVNYRTIDRPKTTIKTALLSIFLFVLATGVFVWLIQIALQAVGILAYLPFSVQVFYATHPILSIVILSAILVCAELFFCLKYAVIGAIKLYQHYAHEDIRRRCLFMPTCSEYAILAVRRYGALIGICKAWHRLVFLCRGNIYKIHYPWEDA